MMRKYRRKEFQAQEMARTKVHGIRSTVLGVWLLGADQANKVIASPIRKSWPKKLERTAGAMLRSLEVF